MYTTVTPAYGRDYKSGKAAKADWAAGKDFIINDMFNSFVLITFSKYDGKPINKSDADNAGIKVIIRFDSNRKTVNV